MNSSTNEELSDIGDRFINLPFKKLGYFLSFFISECLTVATVYRSFENEFETTYCFMLCQLCVENQPAFFKSGFANNQPLLVAFSNCRTNWAETVNKQHDGDFLSQKWQNTTCWTVHPTFHRASFMCEFAHLICKFGSQWERKRRNFCLNKSIIWNILTFRKNLDKTICSEQRYSFFWIDETTRQRRKHGFYWRRPSSLGANVKI